MNSWRNFLLDHAGPGAMLRRAYFSERIELGERFNWVSFFNHAMPEIRPREAFNIRSVTLDANAAGIELLDRARLIYFQDWLPQFSIEPARLALRPAITRRIGDRMRRDSDAPAWTFDGDGWYVTGGQQWSFKLEWQGAAPAGAVVSCRVDGSHICALRPGSWRWIKGKLMGRMP